HSHCPRLGILGCAGYARLAMPQQMEDHTCDGSPRETSVTSLVSGIMQDAQDLVNQQLNLFQVEMKNDLRRSATASMPIFAGAIVALAALNLLGIAAALALAAIGPTLPLWGAFAITGAIVVALGACLIWWGKSQFDAFNPLPEQSIEGLKENLQWKTKG